MATITSLCFSPLSSLFKNPTDNNPLFLTNNSPLLSVFLTTQTQRCSTKSLAMGSNEMLGDFGARDPFPAEIESNFGDKVGNLDTEHKILIPNIAALSLAQQDFLPVSPSHPPLSEEEAQMLLRKVVGWRLVNVEGQQRLQCLWKVRDFKCGVELINRIFTVVEAVGYFPDLHLEQPNQVRAQLWAASTGGLSMNDFIVAAKIDEIKTSDLVPKKRAWA
ncbi:hypothetical protein RJ640_026208 [Escallonia rubra]|uniref:4a-hydroxytetrahydrobiopterin dehydratase n=1 Tax=Escallonia rubra TaxID=112253 RepID=A0AA88RTN8_9ASTE|nr:hypothetical protein RJ640_026208 [Escallonia rubra]